MQPHERIILPLDVSTYKEAKELLLTNDLYKHIGAVKVGLQLYTAAGSPSMGRVGSEYQRGLATMLDLKLHDIPNTVANAVKVIGDSGAKFATVHATGGRKMLEAAANASPDNLTLLAVTLLTSIENLKELLIDNYTIESYVYTIAQQAWDCGIRGFVCSPKEVRLLRENFSEATLVVPGIRPAGSDADDQKRKATPYNAINAGADYLVIGRPIRNASDPVKAAQDIAKEIERAVDDRNA